MRASGRLRDDARGATLAEFAVILPVMMLAIMGLSELCYRLYVQAILEGATQTASRAATIQGGAERSAQFDAAVTRAIHHIAPQATYAATRMSYATFAAIAPERYTDSNRNNRRDAGECYDDINANRAWDANPGIQGQGGANDVSAYAVTIVYPRLFPLARLAGWTPTQTLTVSTYLKNQPYATQSVRAMATICT